MQSAAEQFFSYVAMRAEKDPEPEVINHCGWDCCAIGDFLMAAGCPYQIDEAKASTLQRRLFSDLNEDHYFIFESLNQGCAPNPECDSIYDYGDLDHFIQKHRGDGPSEWIAAEIEYESSR